MKKQFDEQSSERINTMVEKLKHHSPDKAKNRVSDIVVDTPGPNPHAISYRRATERINVMPDVIDPYSYKEGTANFLLILEGKK